MKIIDAQKALKKIQKFANAGDNEHAHRTEKQLWEDVLEAVKMGSGDAQGLAYEALQSKNIAFERWLA